MGTIWCPRLPADIAPKYRAVIHAIEEGIETGALAVGEKLPPVRELAWTLEMTPGTIARAYTILTDAGRLRAEVGRGTFVAEPRPSVPQDKPIEVDVIAHRSGEGGDTYEVNMFSPHLPAVGQSALIRQLLGQVAANPASGMMHYPSRTGAAPARLAVERWLEGTPLGAFDEEDVILSHGGQNGLQMVYQAVLSGKSPTILIEELAYPGFRRAAELLRAEVVPVAMDAQGVLPEALEDAARMHQAQVFCTSPEVHNPTGVFTPLERRQAIVDVARRTGLHIVEDDCYRMRTERAPTYRLLAPERGWYVSSLAKTLTPALRIGFAIGPKEHTARLRRVAEHSCFGLATPLIDLCAVLLVHPQIDALAQAASDEINNYVRRAVNILGSYDLRWRKDVPFLWLHLPRGWRSGAFCQAAEAVGIKIRSAEEFVCRDARAPHAVRIAINAGVSVNSHEAALVRLRELLDHPPEQIAV